MIQPLPTYTLFPYTTLFRSAKDHDQVFLVLFVDGVHGVAELFGRLRGRDGLDVAAAYGAMQLPARPYPGRSEEHTSELQSQFHLVCRLLLEKKKDAFLQMNR